MSLQNLKSILQQSGIVGAGGAGFPSYAKLAEGADTLVLNCACDHQADLLRGWIVDTDTMQYRAVEL